MMRRRPSRRALSAVVAAAATAAAIVATIDAKAGPDRVAPRATATAVEVSRPGWPALRFADAAAGGPVAGARAIAVPNDGSLVQVAAAGAGATTGPDAVAGVASAVQVRLLGGEVAADAVSISERSGGRNGSATAPALTITGLTVLGTRIGARPGARIAVGDWAVLEVGARQPTDHGRGSSVSALRLRLVATHRGVAAGTVVSVGRVVAVGAPPAPPRTPTARATARVIAIADVGARLTPGRRAFPLSRRTSVTATYGAPRAGVRWHHGVDLFGPRGTPVLAVADGTLFEVGWNARGGHRLWLRDAAGNGYYYAHLDAYTPAARNGARVRAGQPLGILGTSGDAESTPPHLHFEVHPASLRPLGYDGAVDPAPYLAAWALGDDLAVSATPPFLARHTVAVQPAAVLLEAGDR